MAVIINEFEVITERPSAAADRAPAQDAAKPKPQPVSVTEVKGILGHQAARASRVRAH